MKINFKLHGIDDAMEAVRNVGGVMTNERMTPLAMEALQPVLDTARELAPVHTGKLRDNIVISDELRPTSRKRNEEGTVYVGILADHAYHARFVEFGTVHMQAQPFLGPAFEQHRDQIIDILGKGAGRLILSAN